MQFSFQFWTCQDIFSSWIKKIPRGECLWISKEIAGKLRFANARTSQAAVTCPMVTNAHCYQSFIPTLFNLTVVTCQKSWNGPISLCMDVFIALTLSVSVKWGKSQSLPFLCTSFHLCDFFFLSYQMHELTANDRCLLCVIHFDPSSLHFLLVCLSLFLVLKELLYIQF